MDGPVIDLRDRPVPPPSAEEVVAWLRHPSGSLGERTMKAHAADLIEEALQGSNKIPG